jgi:hypothetical protein
VCAGRGAPAGSSPSARPMSCCRPWSTSRCCSRSATGRGCGCWRPSASTARRSWPPAARSANCGREGRGKRGESRPDAHRRRRGAGPVPRARRAVGTVQRAADRRRHPDARRRPGWRERRVRRGQPPANRTRVPRRPVRGSAQARRDRRPAG